MAKKIMKSSGNVNATAKKINNKFMSVMTIIALCVILASASAYSQTTNITVSPLGTGTVTQNGSSFTITPNYGWYVDSIFWNNNFVGVYVPSACIPIPFLYTPSSWLSPNNNIRVVFRQYAGMPTVAAIATPFQGGTINPPIASSFILYRQVDMEITANPGWSIASIKLDGVIQYTNIGSSSCLTFYRISPIIHHICHTLEVAFEQITGISTVDVFLGDGGTITVPSGVGHNGGIFSNPANPGVVTPPLNQQFDYTMCENLMFRIYADSCYEIEGIWVDNLLMQNSPGTSMYLLHLDVNMSYHRIVVRFIPRQTIDVSASVVGATGVGIGGGGVITPVVLLNNSIQMPACQPFGFEICPDPGYDIDWVGANVDFKAANNWQNLPMPRHYDLAAHIIQSSSNPSCYKLEWTSTHDYELVVKFAKVWNITASTNATWGYLDPSGSVSVLEGRNQTFEFRPDVFGNQVKSVVVDGFDITSNIVFDPNGYGSYTFINVQNNHTIHIEY